MSKRRLFAATNFCLAAFPPLVGFYRLWDALRPLIPKDPVTIFLAGFAIGFCFAVSGIFFAISISPGEK